MRLYIKESNYIIETIDDIKKYYPNISDDIFIQLIQLDPTYRGNDSAGKYSKWLLNLYNRGNLSQEEFDEVPNILNQFTTYRNRIANKDLNSYKSLDALADVLATVIEDDSMLTDRQKLRFLKNVKSGKIKTSAADDYDVVLETPTFIVYVPNTHEASMLLGKDTKWCTAYEDPHWYNHYTKDNGKLYIIKNKETGNRWQYSNLTGDFLNEWDSHFSIADLMKQDKKLSKFFEKFLGIDYYRFDGTYIYDGTNPVGYDLKKYVTKIIIDNNVTEIGEDAFNNCKNVKRIDIPDNVTKIGKKAFCDCENLKSIMIPNSVTKIGFEAFVDCESLKSINIPDSVTEIEEYAFCRCKNLTSITLSNSITKLMEGVFAGCKNLKSITIPNSVTYIGIYAFDGCTNLKSIIIPDSVTTIGGCAFRECTNLKSITIPNSVTEIREAVFRSCVNLKSVIIPDSVTKIGHDVFNGCTNLKSVTIPNSVTEIGEDAFWHCENLTVRSNNKYIIDYCKEQNIPVRPLSNKESYLQNNRYKLHIKETYELKESNRPNVFNNNSRETYGDLINPNSKVGNVTTHDYYKFEKGKDAILTYMTADEYIDRCINNVFKSNYTKTITNAIDWDKVNEYAELMKQGTKFPTPYLDYVNAGQEGRHRALAFKQAFGKDVEMPVIELYPSNPTLDEIYDYCTQKWQDGEQWMEYVAPNFGYTTKEIYDYLGKEYIEPEEDEEQEDYIDVDIDIDDDDDIDIDEFNEFVKDRSNGEITDVYKLPADEFMKWLTKFTKIL